MSLKKVLAVGFFAATILASPYAIAYTLPTTESQVQISSAQVSNVRVSQETAQQIHSELSELIYVNSFPELSPDATRLLNVTDCGSYAIDAASRLYDLGYNPYIIHLEDNHKTQHWIVLYNDVNGWGSIGGLGWDNKPPTNKSIDDLFKVVSGNTGYDRYFIFQFSPDIYTGYKKLKFKAPSYNNLFKK